MKKAAFLLLVFLARTSAASSPDEEISRLVRLLGSDRLEERETASRDLLRLGARHPEKVLAALPGEDPDPEVRQRCARLRLLIPWERAYREAREQAEDDRQREALDRLHRSFSPGTLGEIVPLFKERRGAADLVRMAAIFLVDPDPARRGMAANALGSLGEKSAAPDLARLFQDESLPVRRNALAALGQLKGGSLAVEIASFLRDPEPSVRGSAAILLGRLGERSAIADLLALLRDPEGCSWAAATALGTLGDKSVIPDLLALLDDPSPQTRAVAAEALRYLGACPKRPPRE